MKKSVTNLISHKTKNEKQDCVFKVRNNFGRVDDLIEVSCTLRNDASS